MGELLRWVLVRYKIEKILTDTYDPGAKGYPKLPNTGKPAG